jgi:hypothetical protein
METKKAKNATIRAQQFAMRPPHQLYQQCFSKVFKAKNRVMNYHRRLIIDQDTEVAELKCRVVDGYQEAFDANKKAWQKVSEISTAIKQLSQKAREKVPVPEVLKEALESAETEYKKCKTQLIEVNKLANKNAQVKEMYSRHKEDRERIIGEFVDTLGLTCGDIETIAGKTGDINRRMSSIMENRKKGKFSQPRYSEFCGEGSSKYRDRGNSPLRLVVPNSVIENFVIKLRAKREQKLAQRESGVVSRRSITVKGNQSQCRIYFRMKCGEVEAFECPEGDPLAGCRKDGTVIVPCDFRMHSPFLRGERIKSVTIKCERVKARLKWWVIFTLENMKSKREVRPNRFAAVHVGRRVMPDGRIRVAKLLGCDGHSEEVYLPRGTVSRNEKAMGFKSDLDREFDAIRDKLTAFIGVSTVPDWLSDECKFVHKWKSPQKMLDLESQWLDNRFPGDERMIHALSSWHAEHQRISEREANRRVGAQNKREYEYKNRIAQWRKRYQFIAVAKVDEAKLAEKKSDSKERDTNVKRIARLVSPGRFVELLKTRFCEELLEVDSANITKTCSQCSHVNKWKDQRALVLQCEKCKTEFDQDQNALENVYESGLSYLNAESESIESSVKQSHIVKKGGHFAELKERKRLRELEAAK